MRGVGQVAGPPALRQLMPAISSRPQVLGVFHPAVRRRVSRAGIPGEPVAAEDRLVAVRAEHDLDRGIRYPHLRHDRAGRQVGDPDEPLAGPGVPADRAAAVGTQPHGGQSRQGLIPRIAWLRRWRTGGPAPGHPLVTPPRAAGKAGHTITPSPSAPMGCLTIGKFGAVGQVVPPHPGLQLNFHGECPGGTLPTGLVETSWHRHEPACRCSPWRRLVSGWPAAGPGNAGRWPCRGSSPGETGPTRLAVLGRLGLSGYRGHHGYPCPQGLRGLRHCPDPERDSRAYPPGQPTRAAAHPHEHAAARPRAGPKGRWEWPGEFWPGEFRLGCLGPGWLGPGWLGLGEWLGPEARRPQAWQGQGAQHGPVAAAGRSDHDLVRLAVQRPGRCLDAAGTRDRVRRPGTGPQRAGPRPAAPAGRGGPGVPRRGDRCRRDHVVEHGQRRRPGHDRVHPRGFRLAGVGGAAAAGPARLAVPAPSGSQRRDRAGDHRLVGAGGRRAGPGAYRTRHPQPHRRRRRDACRGRPDRVLRFRAPGGGRDAVDRGPAAGPAVRVRPAGDHGHSAAPGARPAGRTARPDRPRPGRPTSRTAPTPARSPAGERGPAANGRPPSRPGTTPSLTTPRCCGARREPPGRAPPLSPGPGPRPPPAGPGTPPAQTTVPAQRTPTTTRACWTCWDSGRPPAAGSPRRVTRPPVRRPGRWPPAASS